MSSVSSAAIASRLRTEAPSVLLLALIGALALAGGASRADVSGQVLVAIIAPAVIVCAIFAIPGVKLGEVRWPALILAAAAAIVAIQLIPLPPGLWRALPGHGTFADLPALLGADPWRPIALAPDAAWIALASLMVPAACFYLLCATDMDQTHRVLMTLIGVVLLSAVLGVLQFSSAGWENPLVNASAGEPSGIFANRNHQALFLAIGIVLVTLRFLVGRRASIEAAACAAMVALLLLSILATGSRAGLVVGGAGLTVSAVLVVGAFRHRRPTISPVVMGGVAAGLVVALGLLAIVSVSSKRAESFNRLTSLDVSADFRSRALPTVVAATKEYFPVGSGFGSFDPVFRQHEPDALLKLTYFNHAHNDFLEIVLEGGLLAAALLVAAVGWIGLASVRAWRRPFDTTGVAARGASAILILILIASVVDYPARTPMIMAILAISSCWLAAPDRWWRHIPDRKLYRRPISG